MRIPSRFVVGAASVILALFLRKPDAFLLPQLWAEDGALFYRDALAMGEAALVRPYAGYYHLFPRLGAAVFSRADPDAVPLLFNAFGIASHLCVAAMLLSVRNPLPWKPVLLLLTVLAPVTPEVFVNLTNSQWVLALLLPLLLIVSAPETTLTLIVDVLIAAAASLTGPFSSIIAPLFVARAAIDRTRYRTAMAAVVCAGGLLQARDLGSVMVASKGEATASHFLINISDFFSSSVTGWPPINTGHLATAHVGWAVGGLTLLAAGFLFFWRHRAVPCLYLLSAVVLFVAAAIFKFHDNPALLSGGSRYFFIPTVLLYWCGVAAVSLSGSRIGAVVLLAMLVDFWFSPEFQARPLKDFGWKTFTPCLRERRACSIPINPEGWRIEIDRSLLEP